MAYHSREQKTYKDELIYKILEIVCQETSVNGCKAEEDRLYLFETIDLEWMWENWFKRLDKKNAVSNYRNRSWWFLI